MYRVRRHVFLRTLRPLVTPRMRVLDVGSGTGFYIDRWHELGVSSVTGADLTETAVEQLRRRYPADRFVRFDVTEEGAPLEPGSFELVSAMDVLFHVVERRPMFVLLNAPVDSRSRLLGTTWHVLSSASARRNVLGAILGAVAYPLELGLLSRVREGPSTELMVCRRPEVPAAGMDATQSP